MICFALSIFSGQNKLSPSTKDKDDQAETLLSLIRFPQMKPSELVELQSILKTAKQKKAVWLHLAEISTGGERGEKEKSIELLLKIYGRPHPVELPVTLSLLT